MDDALALAQKLKVLADRGVGGERTNARRALDRLMAKHGITWSDLEYIERLERSYVWKSKNHQLFTAQVVVSVFADARLFERPKTKEILVELSHGEHLEVLLKLDHYWALYQKEHSIFFEAFIRGNDLVRHVEPTQSDELPTDEEWQRMRRVLAMSQTIDKTTPNRRLTAATT